MNAQNSVISDPGIDDMIALALLETLTKGQSQTLVSTFGNAPEQVTSTNACEFVGCVAPYWDVMRGVALPLSGVVEHPWPDYFHGPDGMWGVHPVGVLPVKPTKGRIYPNIISLAPMTHLYRMQKVGMVKSCVVMGGAFAISGNETAYAETNIAFDPDAAARFFEGCTSGTVRVVPLDVTRKVYWSKEKVQTIQETNKKNRWLKRMLLAWFDRYDHDKEKDFNLHDPLAVYAGFYPDVAIWKTSGVYVETKGIKRGQTVLDAQLPLCSIAMDLKNPKQIADDIFSLVFSDV
jgi:purine nucleosidase